MIKCAVVGASGYTGLELVKILLNHPEFEISCLATSEGGERIETLHPSLKEVFSKEVEKADAKEIAKYAISHFWLCRTRHPWDSPRIFSILA